MIDNFESTGIVENLQEGIIIVNLGGRIEYVNTMLEEMLSFTKNELCNQPIFDLIIGRDLHEEWSLLVNMVMEKGSYEFPDGKLLRRNGRALPVRMTLYSMRRPADKDSWIVFYVLDTSREISTNNELEKKYEEVKKENTELQRKTDELKHISELKTKFLGIASHELKTPLTSIKGYSEILLESMPDELSPQVKRMVERISSAADKLHNVVNDMLDVSRIEQQRLRLRPTEINLGSIAEDAVDELYHFFSKRNITPVINVENNLPLFFGDKTRIHQIFINLISNAIKYSPDTTKVTISISVGDEDNFHIIVKDQGLGIADREKENIFAAFYEISNTANHSTGGSKFMGGGTGLGLSIVKGLVHNHGGTIWVESEGPDAPLERRGSEFHIYFPVKSRLHWSDEETQVGILPEIMSPLAPVLVENYDDRNPADKKTILIVDEESETMELCEVILGDFYNLLRVENGECAMKLALDHHRRPDLILLNFYMPGLSGPQICRFIKSLPETASIPVAFFSAATQDNEVEHCQKCGGDGFIVKPFKSRDLIEKVDYLIRREVDPSKGSHAETC